MSDYHYLPQSYPLFALCYKAEESSLTYVLAKVIGWSISFGPSGENYSNAIVADDNSQPAMLGEFLDRRALVFHTFMTPEKDSIGAAALDREIKGISVNQRRTSQVIPPMPGKASH
jgi:hypothetical protein